jgi:hypothetical protein
MRVDCAIRLRLCVFRLYAAQRARLPSFTDECRRRAVRLKSSNTGFGSTTPLRAVGDTGEVVMEWREKLRIDAGGRNVDGAPIRTCADRVGDPATRESTPLNTVQGNVFTRPHQVRARRALHDVQLPTRASVREPVWGRCVSTCRTNVPLQPGALVGGDVHDILWVERLPVV